MVGPDKRLSGLSQPSPSGGYQLKVLATKTYGVTRHEFAPFTKLGLAVNRHGAGSNRLLGCSATGHQPLKLEYLVELDRLPVDQYGLQKWLP